MRALVELVRAPAALTVPGDVLAGATAAGAVRRPRAALAVAVAHPLAKRLSARVSTT
ncbi:hypothetical protein ACIHFD_29740 [Nonomuraea sp. NPDC051941]|uniref:hypothetical protein n=1 Tax=Nonomuraea sp. NPDC051941 TaxID=3364373 RepID=UPI0037C91226